MKNNGKEKCFKCLKWTGIIILLLIFVLYIVIASLYLAINYKVYNIIQSSTERIEIQYNFKYLTLCNKNIQYIKDMGKSFNIVNSEYQIRLNNDKLSNFMIIDLKKEYIEDNKQIFDGNPYYKVSLSKNSNIDAIDSIIIDLKNKIKSDIVDIYDKEYNIFQASQEVENNKVKITPIKEEHKNNQFMIVYVPLKSINISETNVVINKNDSKAINIQLIPQNSTNKNIIFNIENDSIATINTTGIITGKSAGKTNIEIGVERETARNNLEVEVLPILENITLDKTSISLYVGESTIVNAKVDPDNAVNKTLTWSSSDDSIASVDNGKIVGKKIGNCVITVKNTEGNIIEKKINIGVVNKPVYRAPSTSSVTGVTYIKGILVVNKKYGLPSNYNPGVNGTAYNALQKLQADARNAGHNIPLRSGFRSYNTQYTLYNRYVSQYGQALTDTFSARPGHSEHQTGLAFDVGAVDDNYGNTAAGIWLAQNCHKYGFIIRYPKGKQSITGYKYEPWHIRYLGTDIATSVYNSGLCLEEYLGI